LEEFKSETMFDVCLIYGSLKVALGLRYHARTTCFGGGRDCRALGLFENTLPLAVFFLWLLKSV